MPCLEQVTGRLPKYFVSACAAAFLRSTGTDRAKKMLRVNGNHSVANKKDTVKAGSTLLPVLCLLCPSLEPSLLFSMACFAWRFGREQCDVGSLFLHLLFAGCASRLCPVCALVFTMEQEEETCKGL
jgi:hypothetical protein